MRDLRNRFASSYAGVAWNIGVPLLYAGINVVVFSILMTGKMGARYADIPFALFYFVPFSLWTLFSETVTRSTGILREYGYLINKIAFPFWILPLVPLASALLSQGILLVLAGLLMGYYGIAPAASAVYFPLIWLISLMLTLGVAYGVAAVSVYVPDFAQIVPVAVNIVFWLTPILYPATLVEQGGTLWVRAVIMDCNPFFYIVEASRHAVFGSAPLVGGVLATMTLASLAALLAGALIFRKFKAGFADVI